MRTASDAELSDLAVSLLNRGVAPRSIWDGLFLAGGELLMRQPGIVSLHTLTSLNALHYSFQTMTGDDHARKMQLLQAAAFLPQFRDRMKGGKLADIQIDKLEVPNDPVPPKDPAEVFAMLSKDKLSATRMALTYLQSKPGSERDLIDAGRRLIFLKGTDAHDYKFSSAIMEDCGHLAAEHRRTFLAASLFWLKGSAAPDAPLVRRIHAALG